MRKRLHLRALRLSTWALLVATVGTTATAEADFNPFERKRPGRAKPAAPRRPATTPKPQAPAAPHERDTDALIARYTGIVLARPGEPFPLQRLAELYRERDGNVDKLVAEFEERVAKGGSAQYANLVALAGIYKQDARVPDAIQTYERAIAERPKDPAALMALGHLLDDRGDKAGARAKFEAALPNVTAPTTIEQLLRTLMTLSLDVKDFAAAERYHDQIVKRAKGSFFARAELGRELLSRSEYERAEAEFREVVKQAAGDNRALAPALRDLGQALAKQKKRDEALSVLKRALHAAGGQSGLRREIFDIVVEVHRAENKLPELITLLEAERPTDFERRVLLGNLYEETGRVDDALAMYEKALKARADDITVRLKVIQLLQVQGELDEAIGHYAHLIRAAPHNPDFVFQLAEAYIQRGDRDAALAQLQKLEARSQGDEDTMAALVDFYERVGEQPRAQALLERLANSARTDPRHVVELGDRYYQEGNEKRALEVWQRIRVIVRDRAQAEHTLGEVYLEHDMPDRALAALEKAMELAPKETKYRKAYALALERSGSTAPAALRSRRYEQAQKIWEQLMRADNTNTHLGREARQHIVTLWSLSKKLNEHVRPLERRLQQAPPDLEAGRLLAELYIRLRRYSAAEHTLRTVVGGAPGDVGSYQQLERVLVLQRKLGEAVQVLEKLVKVEPKRAREYYQRMAGYAAELYRDDDAIVYASKAVELSPEDADGHRKLGEMYLRRQDTKKAIAEFRKAISKNDRLFPVYFQLAELLLNSGSADAADKLLRRVVRASPDEELIARSARLSMQINLGRDTLESLERELLPVALGNPQKPIYRRLLVEIYGNLAFPLIHASRSQDEKIASEARTALRTIGERAVKPLLDALRDDRDSQQRTAIELLGHIKNRAAGSALFTYATSSEDPGLRMRAMTAVGALQDPSLLPKLAELLAPNGYPRADETDTVAIAAAWSVARMGSPKAHPLLITLTKSDAPSIRSLALLGLGLHGRQSDAPHLAQMVRDAQSGATVRAAAAFALGELGARSEEPALRQLAEAPDPLSRSAALVALARLGSDAAPLAASQALVSPQPELRKAGGAAAVVLATGDYRRPGEALPIPDGRVDVRQTLEHLLPSGYSATDRATALALLAEPLVRACIAAAQSSPDRARVVADSLLARGGAPAFGELTRDLAKADPKARTAAENAATRIASSVVAPFIALAEHPSPDVRILTIRFLASRADPAAEETVLAAIQDQDPVVQRAALSAVENLEGPESIRAITELLASNPDWPVRVRALSALGVVAQGTSSPAASEVLAAVAVTDAYALVREQAVRSLPLVAPEKARTVLKQVSEQDPEPRVRRLAQSLLEKP